MLAIAKFKACILPSTFMDPEQSARMNRWSGRREIPPPGMIVVMGHYRADERLETEIAMIGDHAAGWHQYLPIK